jgi:phage gp36-like protein
MAQTLYCDPEDLGRLAVNRETYEDLAQQEQIAPLIDSASNLMDDYLREVFTLPLLTWGNSLRECCAVLTAFSMLSTRGQKPTDGDIRDSPLGVRWTFWMGWLAKVAAGSVTPEVTDSGGSDSSGGAAAREPQVSSLESRGYTDGGGAFSGRRR